MGKLLGLYVNKVIKFLAYHGEMICESAWQTAATKVRTGNQRDAFGWGVYYKKKLVRFGYGGPMIATESHRDKWGDDSFGREWIFDWLNNEFIPETDGFCLVVANAAYYSISHEAGDTPTGRKYRIISQIYNYVKAVGNGFKGSVTKAYNFR